MDDISPITRRRVLAGAAALAALPLGARAARRVADSAGRAVELPERASRVFAAGPPAAIFLYTLAPDLLTGWTTAIGQEARPFMPERYADLPELGRLTGRGNTANIEVVLAARPDFVFDYGSTATTFVSLADRVQAQTGLPYLLLDGRLDAIPEAYRLLGEMTGAAERAASLGAYARDVLAEVDAAVSATPEATRPRVYYGRGPAGLQTALAGSINVEAIERAGARNVAAEAQGRGGLVNVSPEDVLAWDPEVIVTIEPAFHRLVWDHPVWSATRAVRAGRVHLAPTLPFGWVDFPPSVNRLIGVRWLASVLYPDRLGTDARALARDFYARFYHQRPGEAQLDRLLRFAGGGRP